MPTGDTGAGTYGISRWRGGGNPLLKKTELTEAEKIEKETEQMVFTNESNQRRRQRRQEGQQGMQTFFRRSDMGSGTAGRQVGAGGYRSFFS